MVVWMNDHLSLSYFGRHTRKDGWFIDEHAEKHLIKTLNEESPKGVSQTATPRRFLLDQEYIKVFLFDWLLYLYVSLLVFLKYLLNHCRLNSTCLIFPTYLCLGTCLLFVCYMSLSMCFIFIFSIFKCIWDWEHPVQRLWTTWDSQNIS